MGSDNMLAEIDFRKSAARLEGADHPDEAWLVRRSRLRQRLHRGEGAKQTELVQEKQAKPVLHASSRLRGNCSSLSYPAWRCKLLLAVP